MTRATIIGVGAIGTAIAHALGRRSDMHITLWDIDSSKMPRAIELSDALTNTDIVCMCVPSWVMRPALTSILPFLPKHALVISLAKGIERDTLLTMDMLLKKILPRGQHFGILGGAMLAKEIMQNKGGAGIIGVSSPRALILARKLLKKTDVALEYSLNAKGIALSGVLKNIYALALGLADGLEWSGNRKGWIASCAIQEMEEIIKNLGGKSGVACGLAGLGDMIATGYSIYSKNRQTGHDLAMGKPCCPTSEGVVSLPSLLAILGKKRSQFPLLSALTHIIIHKKDARTTFEKLIPKT
ncbi:MAG: hypothetical protein NUV53_01585 [Patescibacteria group bacterium]|nr:hypothetical protein [Patescibacteria group bacterium]